MPRAHKAKKWKKRKHQYSGERVAVKDDTRYYDAEGYILQYWPNPNSCPTENVVAPAFNKVQPPSWDCTGYGAGLRSGHATSSKQSKNINVCLYGPEKSLTISDKRKQEGVEGRCNMPESDRRSRTETTRESPGPRRRSRSEPWRASRA